MKADVKVEVQLNVVMASNLNIRAKRQYGSWGWFMMLNAEEESFRRRERRVEKVDQTRAITLATRKTKSREAIDRW